MSNPTRTLPLLAATALALLLPCAAPQAQPAPKPTPEAVARHYATAVHAGYRDALDGALVLQKAIDAFLAQPSEATLFRAREAWIGAREWYVPTEAFRFYGGPIDDANGPEGRINAWPMDEAYIDSVKGKPNAGIVNNKKQAITKAALSKLNEQGGEENIATGWHAIEFLLWGQDLSDTGPGNRSYEDYVQGKGRAADRRRTYLKVVTELLIDDLHSLVAAWAADRPDNYRRRFEGEGQEAVRKIFVGIGSLSRGELAGERLEVALNTRDQEDEHSCFSDNTHRDVVGNAVGIQNVWLGRYKRPDGSVLQGPALRDLVAAADAALAERTTRDIAASVAAAEALKPPFDREISGNADGQGRARVQALIDALIAQSKDLPPAAQAIGIQRLTLSTPK
jgi:putative iron-regulated protein